MPPRARVLSDLISAFMLLTRLPVRGTPTPAAADAAWAWPLTGLVVAGLASMLGLGALWLGLSPPAVAALTLLALIAMTGALHEDGLADMADGFWGGFTPERRLEIMRDSRIGAYGVIALVLSLTIRWSLIATAILLLNPLAVVIAAVVSRAPMAVLMRWLPPARTDGLSRGSGVPPLSGVAIGVALAVAALVPAGMSGIVAGLTVIGVTLGMGVLARRKIGGQTGDVLGATQQLSEIAVLVALTSG
ncbi:adenosylcobinamide-GDP ribazoletransferase [Jannaschia donghaensis]|uniref:Adenosylcobinamide-GDP ribazoletransferase n=1 Tax=Jannaschia donghaensis TaxID=420998 RepID=A0A0M6YJD6_9RHOB|nr:adenosylcobinamide-GDP ribazoletransferase [Jannaschia donghaensis]CTQ49909.1 Cobalamin synthase [Jannaschia donghaensis]